MSKPSTPANTFNQPKVREQCKIQVGCVLDNLHAIDGQDCAHASFSLHLYHDSFLPMAQLRLYARRDQTLDIGQRNRRL